jgi:hypothetical protein
MDLEEAKMHESHAYVEEKYLRLIEIGSTEKVICAIRKHPIGLLSIYLSGIFVSLIVVIASTLVGSWIQHQLNVSFRVDLLVMLVGVRVLRRA